MEDYQCEVTGGGSPRYLNISNLFIVAGHHTYHHILTAPMYMFPLQNNQNMLLLWTAPMLG